MVTHTTEQNIIEQPTTKRNNGSYSVNLADSEITDVTYAKCVSLIIDEYSDNLTPNRNFVLSSSPKLTTLAIDSTIHEFHFAVAITRATPTNLGINFSEYGIGSEIFINLLNIINDARELL